jgi:hypothetical protein
VIDTRGLVIGELAVREKLITREQLDHVISLQERRGFRQPLGALMLEQKLLSHAQLDSLLRQQRHSLSEFEREVSVSGLFGRIAIERGYITEKELAEAIRRQLALDADGKRPKIGQILIAMKSMSLVQFWEIIHSQGLFKCGGCGHILNAPRIDGLALFCEKCGKAAITVDES